MTEFLLGALVASCYMLLLWGIYDTIVRPVVEKMKDALDKEAGGDDGQP